jgi:hypothetical protein
VRVRRPRPPDSKVRRDPRDRKGRKVQPDRPVRWLPVPRDLSDPQDKSVLRELPEQRVLPVVRRVRQDRLARRVLQDPLVGLPVPRDRLDPLVRRDPREGLPAPREPQVLQVRLGCKVRKALPVLREVQAAPVPQARLALRGQDRPDPQDLPVKLAQLEPSGRRDSKGLPEARAPLVLLASRDQPDSSARQDKPSRERKDRPVPKGRQARSVDPQGLRVSSGLRDRQVGR